MDYKVASISCIERITDEVVLKRLYSIIKKADKKSRCAPACRPERNEPPQDDLPNDICVTVHNRRSR